MRVWSSVKGPLFRVNLHGRMKGANALHHCVAEHCIWDRQRGRQIKDIQEYCILRSTSNSAFEMSYLHELGRSTKGLAPRIAKRELNFYGSSNSAKVVPATEWRPALLCQGLPFITMESQPIEVAAICLDGPHDAPQHWTSLLHLVISRDCGGGPSCRSFCRLRNHLFDHEATAGHFLPRHYKPFHCLIEAGGNLDAAINARPAIHLRCVEGVTSLNLEGAHGVVPDAYNLRHDHGCNNGALPKAASTIAEGSTLLTAGARHAVHRILRS
mmetsp:Transcript_44111/g.81113  ORF Transcript_44111/g.81113 Transcript_44111/m.81113 type:complete len:270 (+) Transcript_44111:581-1390(+)